MSNNNESCGTCLERRAPYPKNLEKKESGSSWAFWKSSPKPQTCECGKVKEVKKEECAPKEDVCKPKVDACAPAPKEDTCKAACVVAKPKEEECKKDKCPPMPQREVPYLCMPAWFTCPPTITVPPYPSPKGVEIRPISEGGRNSKCEGGKCGKCGLDKPVSGPPKVSPNCPMVRPKCPNQVMAVVVKKEEGILKKISSFLGIGGEKKEKKKSEKSEKSSSSSD